MDIRVVGEHFIEEGSGLIVNAAGNRMPAKSVIFCKKRPFVITEDGDINLFAGGEMDVIYQAADEGFNFLENQVRDLKAERNQSIITSTFRTLTGTRHKTRRKQVTGIPPMPITQGAVIPTVIPSVVANPETPVTNANPGQEVLTTALDAKAMKEGELSAPETALSATTASNEC